MDFSSLQVCMDSSDWLQVPVSDENTGLMDSSPITTPTGDCEDHILTCSGPIIERRLRPQHEQALKCPRCESTHTKFCYYNNYSLTQPRYFCKTCRRYWTKGGTLRNIPVGGSCRKNKKPSSSSKKPFPTTTTTTTTGPDQISLHLPSSASLSSPLVLDHTRATSPNDLQLAFPEQLQFSSMHGSGLFTPANAGYLFENIGPGPSPNLVEYMGSKYDHASFMGMQNPSHDFHGMGSNVNNPLFGFATNYEHVTDNPTTGGINNILDSCQRLMLPYDDTHNNHHHLDNIHNNNYINNNNDNNNNYQQVDVKPNAKILSLEWHDCNSDAGNKDNFGYNLGGLGPWTGLMNGYVPSATNPLV